MINHPKKRLIEALKNVDAHGDCAHADRHVPHRQLNRVLDLRTIALGATD